MIPNTEFCGKNYKVTYSKYRYFDRMKELGRGQCTIVTGEMINFNPCSEIALATKNGIYVIPYSSIIFIEPID